MHAKKAVGRDPAGEIVPELTLDEAWHDAVLLAGFRQEGLERTGECRVKDPARRVPGDVLAGMRPRRARLADIGSGRPISCQ